MKHKYFFGFPLIVLCLCLYLFHIIYAEAKEKAFAELNSRQMIHARQAQRGIEDFFSNLISSLARISESDHIVDIGDWGKRELEFALNIHPEAITAVTRVDASGKIAYTLPYDPALIGKDISGQKHVQMIMKTHRPVVSDVFTAVQGYAAIALHVPVLRANQYHGTLGALIDFRVISKRFLEVVQIGETGYAWMTSGEGTELYCPVPGHTGKSVFENSKDSPTIISMAKEMLKGLSGTTTYLFDRVDDQHRETVKKHAVYLPVKIGDNFWSIVVASDEDELVASLAGFRNKIFAVVGLLLFFSSIFSYYSAKAWGIVREAAKRRKAEEALREREDLLRSIFRAAPTGIGVVRDRIFLKVNDLICAMSGYAREELIGKSARILYPSDADFNYVGKEKYRQISESGTGTVETRWQCRDGRIIDVLLSSTPINPRDLSFGVTFTALDITARKKAEEEKEKMQAQLLQAQKMESVGQLAGGVAHDYNNILGAILGYADLCLETLDPSQSLYKNLLEIRSAAVRSAEITRQLLAFARKQTVAPKVVALNAAVEGMLKMLRRLIGENIHLVWLPGAGLWPVKVDPSQIDQIFTNLCINARDAIEGVGKITIETNNAVFDEAYCASHLGFVPGDYVLLAVSDNGSGMDKETLGKIFEPFFTTKVVGQGTGLGMATVYGIVKQNNGFINVYSEPGGGASFKIYLPRHQDTTEPIPEQAPTEPDSGGRETVLLVEDDPAILRLTTMMMERLGYTVLEASTPGEAIRLAETCPGQIDLLITDVVMPEMNGRDLAMQLMSRYPALRCLFMSGYTANVIAHRGVLDEGVNFIQKPFSKKDLAIQVRKALAGERSE